MLMGDLEFYKECVGMHEEYRSGEYELVDERIESLMTSQISRLDRHGTLYAYAGMVATRLGNYYEAYGHFRKAVDYRYSKASARIMGHIGLLMYWAAKDNEYPVRMSMREIEVLLNEYSVDYWLCESMRELVLDMARLKRYEDAKKYYGLTLQIYDRFHAERSNVDDSLYDPQKIMRMRAELDYAFATNVLMERGKYEEAVRVISYGPLVAYAQLDMKKEYAECFRRLSQSYTRLGKREQALLAEKNCWHQLEVGSEESFVSSARIYELALEAGQNPLGQLNEIFGRSAKPVDREEYLIAIAKKIKEL